MIPKYSETSQEVEVHEARHNICTHQDELEPGWQCCCTDCQCDSVVAVKAGYAYKGPGPEAHEVIITINPGTLHNRAVISLPANAARYLASVLAFAANDADQLNRDFA